jgi:hypothetical protein
MKDQSKLTHYCLELKQIKADRKVKEELELDIPAKPIIFTKNKYPTIIDINKTEALACDMFVERMLRGRMARQATEKRLDLRSCERTEWRPSTTRN